MKIWVVSPYTHTRTHTCMHAHTPACTHTHMHMHTQPHAHAHTPACTHTHAHTHMYVHIRALKQPCTHTHEYTCTHIHMHTHKHIRTHACTLIHGHTQMTMLLCSSVEQYTGCVVILQYCFLILPNFINTTTPQRTIILFFNLFSVVWRMGYPKALISLLGFALFVYTVLSLFLPYWTSSVDLIENL